MQSTVSPNKIKAAAIASLIQHIHSTTEILSIDCFDTLLWRQTSTPADVFYDLQQAPLHKSLGITARLRIQAEANARQFKLVQQGSTEVTLEEIYQHEFPTLTQDQINTLITEEINLEKNFCYGFEPCYGLITAAYARGIKVIIASDTYLRAQQLQDLLAHCVPIEILSKISTVFVSCEHGRSKSQGLFTKIIDTLHCSPESIYHVGDHSKADFAAAKQAGLHATQIIHHTEEVNETLRMQAVAASMLDTSIRNDRALTNPFRAVIAKELDNIAAPEFVTGFATLGPIMYAFANYILAAYAKNKAAKFVFLMRDSHLPALACEEIAKQNIGRRVRISRFAAIASSLRSQSDIDNYLADKISTRRYEDMATQLLLPETIKRELLHKLSHSDNPSLEFLNFAHQEKIQQLIFTASREYFQRLKQHIIAETNLQNGDELIFIDLGYTGTAQTKLAPLFKQDMNVTVTGLYLLSLPAADINSKREGLLDARHFADKSLIMLVTYIAILEQLCTTPENSVIDFDKNGQPIYSDVGLPPEQNSKLLAIQAECLRFIRSAKRSHKNISAQMLRDTAAINLARLIFLPTKEELNYLQSFEFDFNLGTKQVMSVFDLQKGLTGLRRRSWLHSSRENLKNMRTNYPAEWRAASLELTIALMAQHRFGLEVALNDLSHRREIISIFAMLDGALTTLSLEATPTYDGYYALLVPVVNQDCHLAIKFGTNYQWVELESAELIKMSHLYSRHEFDHAIDATPHLAVDRMSDKGGGLFECESSDSLVAFAPPLNLMNEKHVLRIIFRPVVIRETPQITAVA